MTRNNLDAVYDDPALPSNPMFNGLRLPSEPYPEYRILQQQQQQQQQMSLQQQLAMHQLDPQAFYMTELRNYYHYRMTAAATAAAVETARSLKDIYARGHEPDLDLSLTARIQKWADMGKIASYPNQLAISSEERRIMPTIGETFHEEKVKSPLYRRRDVEIGLDSGENSKSLQFVDRDDDDVEIDVVLDDDNEN